MQLNGAEIVIECLKEQGVDTVFGYPGGAILNVYDELYKHRDEIRHILTSHEQGAAHAADGYARATGKVGVCLATSGPGATNLVTGIATAYMDSIPIVAITCNVGVPLLGKDSFQEIDIAGVTMKNPVTTGSGTFGSGEEFSEFVDLSKLGAVTTKGVANVPWPGNSVPRVAEVYGGMLNAIGLQNPGIDVFVERDIPYLKKAGATIIVNVCGKSEKGLSRGCRKTC